MPMQHTNQETHRCIFLLAGEASGDLYGGMLIQALLEQEPGLKIIAWGGEHMEKAGAQLLRHYKTMAFMGILEVVKNLGTIQGLFRECEEVLQSHQPDAFVGIDYPGFNLKMAKKAKQMGLATHHYISPSLWAWNKRRVHTIRKHIDQLHVILPFEKQWFSNHDVDVNWVGHPLLELESMEGVNRSEHAGNISSYGQSQAPLLALIPGSRKQEVERLLPVFLKAAQQLPQFTAVVSGAPGLEKEDYQLATDQGIEIRFGAMRSLMHASSVGLVTSGTATLEAALLGMPQVICYRTSGLTYHIAKLLARTPWIGLPNILLQKHVVPERIQQDCDHRTLVEDINKLHDGEALLSNGRQQLDQLQPLRNQLQGSGRPSAQVADAILNHRPRKA